MGKKTQLPKFEKGQITAFKEQGLLHRPISKQIKRSKTVMDNFVNQGNAYGYKEGGVQRRKITSRQGREVLRRLSRGGISLKQLAKEDNIPVTKSTLSKIEKRTSNLRYKKKKHP